MQRRYGVAGGRKTRSMPPGPPQPLKLLSLWDGRLTIQHRSQLGPKLLPVDMGDQCGIVMMPRGGAVWAAAECFMAFLELHHEPLLNLIRCPERAGRPRVLELGAGTGVCGLSVQAICRDDVELTLTDCARDVMLLLERNAALNGGTARCEQLIWGQPTSESRIGMYDMVIASDCSYSLPMLKNLFNTMAQLLQLEGVVCLVHADRGDSCPLAEMIAHAREAGFEATGLSGELLGGETTEVYGEKRHNEAGEEQSLTVHLLRRCR